MTFSFLFQIHQNRRFWILYFLLENWSRVLYSERLIFTKLEMFKMYHFLIWFWNWENRHFHYCISNIKKWGILNSKHVTSFQTIKEPKLRNLGHSNKNTDAIAWKILLYIRFRAYSPCSLLLTKEVLRLLRFWAISNWTAKAITWQSRPSHSSRGFSYYLSYY